MAGVGTKLAELLNGSCREKNRMEMSAAIKRKEFFAEPFAWQSKREMDRMGAGVQNPMKMMHVNKRRLQSYKEFIQGYKQYKEEKEKMLTAA